jgi:hypothetical protein
LWQESHLELTGHGQELASAAMLLSGQLSGEYVEAATNASKGANVDNNDY